MATMTFSYRKTKAGFLCTARVTLACGHKLREDAQGRTEATAKTVASRLLRDQITIHQRECRG